MISHQLFFILVRVVVDQEPIPVTHTGQDKNIVTLQKVLSKEKKNHGHFSVEKKLILKKSSWLTISNTFAANFRTLLQPETMRNQIKYWI